MIKEYILFDLDGTLIDSLPLIETSFRHAFEQHGLPWQDGAVMKTVGLPLREACRQFAGDKWQDFFNCYVDYQATIHDQYIKAFPGMQNALEQIRPLARGIGIVTSKRRAMALRGVAVAGIESYVDCIVALEDTQKHKPDAEPVLQCLSRLGALPEQAVFIGDSYFDIESGLNAGVLTIGVAWGMASRDELLAASPHLVVDTWDELVAFLLNKN